MALQCSLLSRNVMPPALFFFLRIALSLEVLLWFNTNFRIVSSISMNNAFSILIGIALNLLMALGKVAILTILMLMIHKHGYPYICLCLQFVSVKFYYFCHYLLIILSYIQKIKKNQSKKLLELILVKQ